MTAREIATTGVDIGNVQLQPIPEDFSELGVIDMLPFSGGFAANELIDTREVTIQSIREMLRKDGQARAIARILTLPLRTADLNVTPNEGVADVDGEEEAEFVKMALTRPRSEGGMSTSIENVKAHMGKALADGFAVFEKVWQITDEGQITLRKLAPRSPETVKFLLDENGGLDGVRQKTHWQGQAIDVTIPAPKLLVYTAQHEENPWYGESYMLPAYYHYDKKHKLYYIAHIASQFHAIPGRIGTYPDQADPKEKKAFRENLAKMGFNTALTKPMGYEVDDFGGQGSMPDYEKLINHQDAMMAKSVLAHFIQLGTGSSSGSWALSEDQSDLFTIALETILKEWSEVFSFYVVPQLIDFNFSTRAYPKISFGPLADSTKEAMYTAFTELADAASVNVTPEFMFQLEQKVAELLGLEIDYEALQAEFEQEKELRARAAQAQIEAMQNPQNREEAGVQPPTEENPDDE